MMNVANDILLSIYNEDLGSIKGLLSKIDDCRSANPSDSKRMAVQLTYRRKHLMQLKKV